MRARRAPWRALLPVMALCAVAGPRATVAHPGTTTRPSALGATTQGNGHTPARSVPDTTSPELSLDGLSLAFSSDASNLVAGDTNLVADVFVRGRDGKVRRVSTARDGTQANGASYSPALSVDGTIIAFVSRATNLIAGDTNLKADVFLKDLKRNTIQRVSVSSHGVQADGDSSTPFVSLFGTHVTFDSLATNLDLIDDNGLADAFLYDVKRKTTTRIAPPPPDEELPEGIRAQTGHAQISYDGRILTFHRRTVREGIETPVTLDVFVRYVKWGGKERRIVMPPWAGLAKKMLENPIVTADGRYIAFEAWSAVTMTHTVGGQSPFGEPTGSDDAITRNPYDIRTIYMYDHAKKVLWPASTNPAGPQANADCYDASVNAYGTVLAFACDADNMVAGDTNDAVDVFVKDFPGGVTQRVSVGADHGEGFGQSTRPSISYEGRRVAFASTVSTFVEGDSNGLDDTFLRDRRTDLPNSAPVLKRPFAGPKGLNLLEEFRFTMRATDLDRDGKAATGDRLRFGAIGVNGGPALPEGATIDPITGVFTWTPTPDQTQQGGKRYDIALWVGDARGHSDFELLTLVVRDAGQTVRCQTLGHACVP